MRTGTVSYKLEDLRKGVIIPIGMVGENDFTRVIFDAEEVFKKHPDAQVTMKVQPPKGGIYPATVTRDGNAVIWQVKAADVAHRGSGELQLTFTADTMVEKSYIARTDIKRSLVGNGPAPDPVQDWVDNAEEVLEDLEAAEVHQPTIGNDGYWYRWDAEAGEYVTTGTKAQGDDGQPGQDGAPGRDGTDATPDLITKDYADLTFPVAEGTYCYHSGLLYYAKQDIQTSEAWTAAHWQQTTVEEQQRLLLNAIQGLDDTVDDLGDLLTEYDEAAVPVALTVQTNGYYDKTGNFVSTTDRAYAIVNNVAAGEKYLLSTFVRPVTIAGIIMYAGNTFYDYDLEGTGSDQTVTDYQITIPNTVTKMIVQSARDSVPPTLKKITETQVSKSYTKTETRNLLAGTPQKYGVRWSVTDPDDLGERCFNAVGLSASIGIGSTDGESDFDSIYPWSDIKRCNIKKNANGAYVVTYEGETGFALDGSNGDVFVRIPKFYVEKYIEDGKEYRVISGTGTIPHKAFIEDGKELDEIFIGAYEGYSNGTVLKSISGVIPTSNLTANQFLTLAETNGNEYSLFDMRCVDALWTLMAVEYGCRNSNQIFGYGVADYMQPIYNSYQICTQAGTGVNTIRTGKWSAGNKAYMPVGSNMTICGNQDQETIVAQRKIISVVDGTDYTDWTFDGDPINVDTDCFIGSAACDTDYIDTCSSPLSWHTGRAAVATGGAALTRNPVRYRWIENPVGNLWHLLPDTLFVSLQMYICENMKDYDLSQLTSAYKAIGALMTEQNSNGQKTDGTGSNYWLTALLDDTFAKGSCIGKSASTELTSAQGFGGYYYMYNKTSPVLIAHGGGFDHLYRCNMLTNRAWIYTTTKWYLYGARLMFKKIS